MSFAAKNWILASRPKTLLAAVVPVIVGSSAAYASGSFFIEYSVVALLCSVLIQVGTNFTNDLYDFLKGADTVSRKGPQRVLASGLISVREMKLAIYLTFLLAFLLGLYLVAVGGVVILAIGLTSIFAGLAYTAGPYPLAYNGLGDIFVFIFFGLVGTMGTYYLHTGEFTLLSFLAAVPVGALITNILVVNNFRDIEEDKAARKYTLAVKIGKNITRWQFIFSLLLSYSIPVLLLLIYNFSFLILLPFISLPVAVKLTAMLYKFEGIQLNKTLELTAKLSAIYGFLFAIGIVI